MDKANWVHPFVPIHVTKNILNQPLCLSQRTIEISHFGRCTASTPRPPDGPANMLRKSRFQGIKRIPSNRDQEIEHIPPQCSDLHSLCDERAVFGAKQHKSHVCYSGLRGTKSLISKDNFIPLSLRKLNGVTNLLCCLCFAYLVDVCNTVYSCLSTSSNCGFPRCNQHGIRFTAWYGLPGVNTKQQRL